MKRLLAWIIFLFIFGLIGCPSSHLQVKPNIQTEKGNNSK